MLALPDVKKLIGYILKVNLNCCNARVQGCRHEMGLIWVDIDKSVDPALKKIRSRPCAKEYKTKKQGKIQRAPPASQLFSAMPPLEAVTVLVSIMMSVSLSNKGKPLKLRHYDISRASYCQGTAQRLIYIKIPAEDRQKYGEDKVDRLVKSIYGTQDASSIWQVDYVNLICGELGGFQEGNIVSQSESRCENGTAWRHLCVCCQMTMDSNTSTVFSNPNTQRKMWEHLDSDVKSLVLLNRVFRVGVDQTGQYLDIELNLRHVPLIISELGCNTNTKAVSTSREKLQDKLVSDGKTWSESKER